MDVLTLTEMEYACTNGLKTPTSLKYGRMPEKKTHSDVFNQLTSGQLCSAHFWRTVGDSEISGLTYFETQCSSYNTRAEAASSLFIYYRFIGLIENEKLLGYVKEGIKACVHQFKVGKTRSENKNNTYLCSFISRFSRTWEGGIAVKNKSGWQ